MPENVAFPVTFRLPVIFNQPSTILSMISPKENVIFCPSVILPVVSILVSVIVVVAETEVERIILLKSNTYIYICLLSFLNLFFTILNPNILSGFLISQ